MLMEVGHADFQGHRACYAIEDVGQWVQSTSCECRPWK